jgi:hypothetical protein
LDNIRLGPSDFYRFLLKDEIGKTPPAAATFRQIQLDRINRLDNIFLVPAGSRAKKLFSLSLGRIGGCLASMVDGNQETSVKRDGTF